MSENGSCDKRGREHADDPEWIVQTENLLRFSPGAVVWADDQKVREFVAYLRAKDLEVPDNLAELIENKVQRIFELLHIPCPVITLRAWKVGFEYSPVMYFTCSAVWDRTQIRTPKCRDGFALLLACELRKLAQCDEAHVTRNVPVGIKQKVDYNVRLWWD